MAGRITFRPEVWDDIEEIADYLLERDAAVAGRFLDAVHGTIRFLSDFPGVGSLKAFRSRRLAKVRSWAVAGFPSYLILYRIHAPSDVEVIAVVHGARRLGRLLGWRLGR